jgi:Ca2+-binding RTX toxin-like protein
MLIYGTNGDDIIEDSARRDQLTGYSGTDTFRLLNDDKTDKILDFEDGVDTIDLTAFNVTWADVQVKYVGDTTFAITINGERTFITFQPPGDGDPAFSQDWLDESDFIFSANAAAAPPNYIYDRPGNDRLYGTDQTDIFVMQLDYYRDVVVRFDPAHDKIDLTPFHLTFDDLTYTEVKAGKIIVDLGTENLVIRDISHTMLVTDITADMFIF